MGQSARSNPRLRPRESLGSAGRYQKGAVTISLKLKIR
jgi:hypothetical protein